MKAAAKQLKGLAVAIHILKSHECFYSTFNPTPSQWFNPFLQDIKDKGGLYDYRVQCDEDTNTPVVIDRNELVARIFVKPTKTAEFVELNFVLTSTGANFDEIFGA